MSNEYEEISVRLLGANKHQSIHGSREEGQTTPHALFAQPITSKLGDSSEVVGYLMGVVALESYLSNLLPKGVRGVTVVLKNTCGDEHTFRLDEEMVSLMCPYESIVSRFSVLPGGTTPLFSGGLRGIGRQEQLRVSEQNCNVQCSH